MKTRLQVYLFILFVTICLVMLSSSVWCDGKKDEEKTGREYANQIEKELVIIDDPEYVDRVQRIGRDLVQIAKEHEVKASYGNSEIYDFKYTFKVVEDEDVNAFALPGGHIYVNTGLLDIIESDDELAGVLAHEIAHVAHHHSTRLLKEQSRLDKYVALIALAGIFGRVKSTDLNNILLGAQMLRTGKTSSQTMDAERDADRTAVAYLAKSKYNTEGLLTFMKILDKKHSENPTLPLGIYKTHPSPFRRIDSITQAMIDEGLAPNVRKLRGVVYAQSVPVDENSDQYKVIICERDVCMPASLKNGGPTSKERAEQIAKRINTMLDSGIRAKDIIENTATGRLVAGNMEIFKVEPEDTKVRKNTEVLAQAKSALDRAAWADWLCNSCIASRELTDVTSD
jgi:hypothetical protein